MPQDRDRLVAAIKRRMERWSSTLTDDDIVAEIQDTQYSVLEGYAEPFWFQKTYSQGALTCTVSQEYVDISGINFLMEMEEGGVWLDNLDSSNEHKELYKNDYDTMKNRWPKNISDQRPQQYTIINEKLYVRPVPDQEYPLHFVYYGRGATLSAGGTTNIWTINAFDLFVAEAGFKIATMLGNPEAQAYFSTEQQRAFKRLNDLNVARQEANFTQEMGD